MRKLLSIFKFSDYDKINRFFQENADCSIDYKIYLAHKEEFLDLYEQNKEATRLMADYLIPNKYMPIEELIRRSSHLETIRCEVQIKAILLDLV